MLEEMIFFFEVEQRSRRNCNDQLVLKRNWHRM
jgi:hypothetical protein